MKSWLIILLFIFSLGHLGLAQTEMYADGKLLTTERCLEIAKQKETEGDKKEATRFLNQAATIEWEKKNYPVAIQYFRQSLNLNQSIGNYSGMTSIYNNLGMIYADLQDYEKSFDYFKKNLEGRRIEGDKINMASGLINLAVIGNDLKLYDQSAQYLQEALDLSRERYDLPQMRACYGMLAETYEKAGDLQKTRYYFELYRDLHEMTFKKTEKKYQKSVEEARLEARLAEIEKRNKELELVSTNQELQTKKEELQKSSETNQKLLANLSKQELINFLIKKESDLKIRNNEIAKLQAEKEKSNAKTKLNQEREYINYLILGIIMLATVAGITYWRFLERRKISRALRQQRNELKQMNQVKDKIFSIVAHDLRSPLTTLQNLLDNLDLVDLNDDELSMIFQNLKNSNRRTLDTVDNLLNWAVSQSKGIIANPVKFDLSEVVKRKVNLFQDSAHLKSIRLNYEIPEEAWTYADSKQIEIVLHNLIANALKFTPIGGTVQLLVEKRQTNWLISVQDSGVGISEENLAKLFKPETHFTTTGTAREKGTGLGLLLCKEFVEKNHGTIEVFSQEGKGSIFKFNLPEAY
ncbi:MAG: ATP-binding protein [Microscillaceae bacterium]|jgi:signal transduction histidine kinase|nr:ATP-binding protein [Microscillaceae bacterium]